MFAETNRSGVGATHGVLACASHTRATHGLPAYPPLELNPAHRKRVVHRHAHHDLGTRSLQLLSIRHICSVEWLHCDVHWLRCENRTAGKQRMAPLRQLRRQQAKDGSHNGRLLRSPQMRHGVPPCGTPHPTLPQLTSGQVRLAAAGGEGAGHTIQDALQGRGGGRPQDESRTAPTEIQGSTALPCVAWATYPKCADNLANVSASPPWLPQLRRHTTLSSRTAVPRPHSRHDDPAARRKKCPTFLPANSSFRLRCLISPPTSSSSCTSGTASPACSRVTRAGATGGAEERRPGSGAARRRHTPHAGRGHARLAGRSAVAPAACRRPGAGCKREVTGGGWPGSAWRGDRCGIESISALRMSPGVNNLRWAPNSP